MCTLHFHLFSAHCTFACTLEVCLILPVSFISVRCSIRVSRVRNSSVIRSRLALRVASYARIMHVKAHYYCSRCARTRTDKKVRPEVLCRAVCSTSIYGSSVQARPENTRNDVAQKCVYFLQTKTLAHTQTHTQRKSGVCIIIIIIAIVIVVIVVVVIRGGPMCSGGSLCVCKNVVMVFPARCMCGTSMPLSESAQLCGKFARSNFASCGENDPCS